MRKKIIMSLFVLILLVLGGCMGGTPFGYCNEPLTYEELINMSCDSLNKMHYDCSCEANVYINICYTIYENQLKINGCYDGK